MHPDDVRIYRRDLPHWRKDDATYFVTWRLAAEQPRLTPLERTVVAASLRYFDQQRYDLVAYVVMDDHVHVIVAPVADWALERLCHSWKSYSAHRMERETGRTGVVWQHEPFDRIVRSEAELREKIRYVLNNPWKRWPDLREYCWVWVKGMEGSLEPD